MPLKHRIQKLNVHFNFTTHGTAEDANRIRKPISDFQPHLYVPEYTPRKIERVEEVERLMEKGKIDADVRGHDFEEFLRTEAQIIVEHSLPVRIVLPYTRRLEELRVKQKDFYVQCGTWFLKGNLDKASELWLESVKVNAQMDELREKALVEALKKFKETLVPKALKKNNTLKDVEELKVLVSLGMTHRSILNLLKGIPEISVSKSFGKAFRVTVFSSRDELLSRLKRGEQIDLVNPQHRLLVARSLIEMAILNDLVKKAFISHADKFYAALRIISSSLSFEEIRDICGNWQHYQRQVLQAILARKGLRIPDSLEAVEEILFHSSSAKHFGLQRKFKAKEGEQ